MSARAQSEPLITPVEEALRILHAAAASGLTLRATGGVAVAIRCASAAHPPLARAYKDLDFVGLGGERRKIDALLIELGYEPDASSNTLHGHSRLVYSGGRNGRKLDIFLDRIVMCHSLELMHRLALDELTLPPADLLLTKLQIVEANEHDLQDAIALIVDEEIEADRVAKVLAADWGWWRTSMEVLHKIESYSTALPAFELAEVVVERVRALHELIDAEPKSLRWKARAKVGDRLRWYELPEESG